MCKCLLVTVDGTVAPQCMCFKCIVWEIQEVNSKFMCKYLCFWWYSSYKIFCVLSVSETFVIDFAVR